MDSADDLGDDCVMTQKRKPKYELSEYRQFIRDAAPFISLIAGRRINKAEADLMTDEQLEELALKIDERVEDLNKRGPAPGVRRDD